MFYVRTPAGMAVCAAVLLLSAPAAAQTCLPGELRIFVKDSQESAIFGARVRVSSATAEAGERATPAMGAADFENVPCGSWTVRASKEGFEDSVGAVQITGQGVVELSLNLNPQINRSSVDVTDTPPPLVEQSASQNYELRPTEVKQLPTNPATVDETLPLVPGIIRSPAGDLKIDGSGEERSSLVVNQSDVTDPATGKFGQTVPVDSIETVNVLSTPFLSQYGRFTQTVVAVETKRGGDKWHADLNDPFPDFVIRSYHMQGIRNETPRGVVGGPVIRDRLFIITALQYFLDKATSRTLGYPFNVSKQERVNSFTQIDYIASPRQIVNGTFHFSPEHTNFVNPNYFNPQPVTPSYAQRSYVATAAHHFGFLDGTLDSSLSYQRFHTFIGAQGDAAMVLTPEGNRGNYFGVRSRDAFRREWLEIWSPAPIRAFGTHQLKLGSSLTVSNDRGQFLFRPVEIFNTAGQRTQRVDFSNQPAFRRTDLEFTDYAQDHWTLSPRLSLDYGLRIEHQRLAQSLRIAPRAGLAWTPFSNGKTVIRTGYGEFYDHIPLDVYTFSRFPERTITNYAASGAILGSPIEYVNVIGSATGPRTFLVNGQQVAGAFSPRGATVNAQIEHRFNSFFRIRGVYTDNRSVGLIVLEPQVLDTTNEIVLNGDGSSRFRQAEITAKVNGKDGQQLVFSYTRSRAEGSLNQFDTFIGNFPVPLVHLDTYTNLAGDVPNRFLVWGHLKVPFKRFEVLPIIEYRNGFPYTVFDAQQNYVGIPNGDATRFPKFFSADARVMRDFKVSPKYTMRLSLSGYNLTNHFNALAIHANIADPQYGIFFGNYHRRYRFDFEVLF
jgi:hypothetical protein